MSANSVQIKVDEKELEKYKRQYYWLRVSRLKLLMDLIFVCAYIVAPGEFSG